MGAQCIFVVSEELKGLNCRENARNCIVVHLKRKESENHLRPLFSGTSMTREVLGTRVGGPI